MWCTSFIFHNINFLHILMSHILRSHAMPPHLYHLVNLSKLHIDGLIRSTRQQGQLPYELWAHEVVCFDLVNS